MCEGMPGCRDGSVTEEDLTNLQQPATGNKCEERNYGKL